MIDTSLIKLCQYRHQLRAETSVLWVIGEAETQLLVQIPERDVIISNRLTSDPELNARLHLSDFTFPTELPDDSMVLMRLAKEKALNQHVIIQASQRAHTITLIGQKSEGIKAYQRFAQRYFAEVSLHKDKQDYWLRCQSPIANTDESNYAQWLHIAHPLLEQPYWSKAGIFSGDHIDPGTGALIDVLVTQAVNFSGQSVLDLGCGSGLLSLIADIFDAESILAVDNNVTALLAAERNFADFDVPAKTLVSHVDHCLPKDWQADVVLCNPPFHQGFDHKKSLTQDFFDAIARRLKPGGEAWVVVNQFIGAESAISNTKLAIKDAVERSGFTVLWLHHRR